MAHPVVRANAHLQYFSRVPQFENPCYKLCKCGLAHKKNVASQDFRIKLILN